MRLTYKSSNTISRSVGLPGRLILLSALVACTQPVGAPDTTLPDGAGTAAPQTAMLTTISVSLSADSAHIGQSAKATASGRDQFGKQFAPGVVTWSTVPDGIATVTTDGAVTGIAEGVVTVWASKAGVQPGSASIVISK